MLTASEVGADVTTAAVGAVEGAIEASKDIGLSAEDAASRSCHRRDRSSWHYRRCCGATCAQVRRGNNQGRQSRCEDGCRQRGRAKVWRLGEKFSCSTRG